MFAAVRAGRKRISTMKATDAQAEVPAASVYWWWAPAGTESKQERNWAMLANSFTGTGPWIKVSVYPLLLMLLAPSSPVHLKPPHLGLEGALFPACLSWALHAFTDSLCSVLRGAQGTPTNSLSMTANVVGVCSPNPQLSSTSTQGGCTCKMANRSYH